MVFYKKHHSCKAKELRIHTKMQPLIGLADRRTDIRYTKKLHLRKRFKVEELRIHSEVQPLIWHALFVALLHKEEHQLSPQTLGNVSR